MTEQLTDVNQETKYVDFIPDRNKYIVYNKIYKQNVDEIRQERMKRRMK